MVMGDLDKRRLLTIHHRYVIIRVLGKRKAREGLFSVGLSSKSRWFP